MQASWFILNPKPQNPNLVYVYVFFSGSGSGDGLCSKDVLSCQNQDGRLSI